MTRIIGGVARGRRLTVPATGTRPTSDRAREAVFSSVVSMVGSLSGLTVLDLFAGSGALGLEALSRGAARVELVEQNRRACAAIEANIESVGLPGATCHHGDVERWLTETPATEATIAFLDPPYENSDESVRKVLMLLAEKAHLVDAGLAVVERSTREGAWSWAPGFTPVKDRRYGEAHLWIGELNTRRTAEETTL